MTEAESERDRLAAIVVDIYRAIYGETSTATVGAILDEAELLPSVVRRLAARAAASEVRDGR